MEIFSRIEMTNEVILLNQNPSRNWISLELPRMHHFHDQKMNNKNLCFILRQNLHKNFFPKWNSANVCFSWVPWKCPQAVMFTKKMNKCREVE